MRHFGAVGWQPTALKSNHGVLKHQGWRELDAFWGCRLATYSTSKQPWGLETQGFGGNLRHFGAVGWQPTALKSNHGVLKHQGWRELDAFWGCRLATYSTEKQPWGLETPGFGANLRHFGHLKATMGS